MAGNEAAAARAKLSGPAQAPRPSSAPSVARPTPIAAVPGAELDALDRAAEGIRPSWHGAAPSTPPASGPVSAALPPLALPAAALPSPAPELASSISGVQPSPLVEPLAPDEPLVAPPPAPELGAPPAAPIASASEVALYYGSDPTPRGADSTQPMAPILLPTPWAQLTGHPLVLRLRDWRAQNPRLALSVGATLAVVMLIALWPSSSAPLPPPPLPPAPEAKQAPLPVDEPPAAVDEPASEAPVAAPSPTAKSARKNAKKREAARPAAAKPALATKPTLAAKPAPKKAVEPAKPAKARGGIAPNPYP